MKALLQLFRSPLPVGPHPPALFSHAGGKREYRNPMPCMEVGVRGGEHKRYIWKERARG